MEGSLGKQDMKELKVSLLSPIKSPTALPSTGQTRKMQKTPMEISFTLQVE